VTPTPASAEALPPEDVVGGQHVEPGGRQSIRHSELADQRVAGGEGDSGAPRPLPAQLHGQFERLLDRPKNGPWGCPQQR